MGVIMYRNNRYAGGGSADPSLHFDWSHQTLPQTGDTNTIYCIPTGDTSDPWDFYAWNDTDQEFVKIDFNMTISIDSALSDTSTNPVQNRVVKSAIDAKADNTQTFTEASTRANIASGETFAVILGKIKKFFTDLKAVAFSGSYNDLSDQPTIPAAQVNSDWNASSGVAQILNKPTIPAAQVNSDWNASSGVAEILNKPSSMPASDVYAWAKAATKPSYTASEVGALASDGTAVAATKATQDGNGANIASTYTPLNKAIVATKGSSKSTADGGDWTAMCISTQTGNPVLPTEGQWWNVISLDNWGGAPNNWVSQLALPTHQNSHVYFRKNNAGNTSIDSAPWVRLLDTTGLIVRTNYTSSNVSWLLVTIKYSAYRTFSGFIITRYGVHAVNIAFGNAADSGTRSVQKIIGDDVTSPAYRIESTQTTFGFKSSRDWNCFTLIGMFTSASDMVYNESILTTSVVASFP